MSINGTLREILEVTFWTRRHKDKVPLNFKDQIVNDAMARLDGKIDTPVTNSEALIDQLEDAYKSAVTDFKATHQRI